MNTSHFMKFILFFSFFIFNSLTFAQNFKSFEGELMYSVELIHPETKKAKFLSFTTIFTNDTLVRTDSENLALGKQTLIRHIALSKQYVLLDYQGKKYAIQQTLPKDTTVSKYTFEKCRGYKRFGGIKAKKILINHPNFKNPLPVYFAEKLNPKYLSILPGIEGLPVKYFLQTEDGLLCYTLREIKSKQIPAAFFSVPKEYEKITFTDFIERISK
jgi:hypothetical protein